MNTRRPTRRTRHPHRPLGVFPARLGQHEPFRDLITDLENALDLTHHKPRSLPRHAPYLHRQAAYRIGSLTRLIRQAAITTISDGTERITKASLEAIRLDHLAETRQPHRHGVGLLVPLLLCGVVGRCAAHGDPSVHRGPEAARLTVTPQAQRSGFTGSPRHHPMS